MQKPLTIHVSGLYSGSNPQPGVGIARSLRLAYPDARLIGVEYSNRCSGVHWQDFDDIWLQRPWSELNLALHAANIKQRLDDGALWISSIDLEIAWLADVFPHGHPNLLTPPQAAVRRVSKPEIPAHTGLPVQIPPYVTTELSDWELHAFCRQHDWRVWLKGPYYEAIRTPTWSDLQHWRNVLSKAWATDTLFLQAHVTGYEESVMFSSVNGDLLDCVYMRKRDVTELGKTWAGDAAAVDPAFEKKLRKVLKDANWTGGGELEMVRDAEDALWLLEWNPRFPAWVHGSTITGRNLPASLVQGATGIDAAPYSVESAEFTRVVIEIPVRPEFPLSPISEPFAKAVGHSMKHPSGLVEFAQKLDRESSGTNGNGHKKQRSELPEAIPQSYVTDLETVNFSSLTTPASIFFSETAAETFRSAARFNTTEPSGIKMSLAYSIKTNPDKRLLTLAKVHGLLAEAISPLEARKAVETGFSTDQIILNGPAKWWRREELPAGTYKAVFCDSVNELKRVVTEVESGDFSTNVIGVRLRSPNIVSRFGIPIDSVELFEELVETIRTVPQDVDFGVHFHLASSNIGVGQWQHLFGSMLRWCASIEALSGRVIKLLDIGGGWFPGDWEPGDGRQNELLRLIGQRLAGVEQVVTEPGKALAQSTMAIAMSVLEIRNYAGGQCEAVMDGSIAEMPMHAFQPHRILSHEAASGAWKPLSRGNTILLGRLCMEHDIVAADVALPDTLKEGDILVFCDAGAYDRSMSYVFGCG